MSAGGSGADAGEAGRSLLAARIASCAPALLRELRAALPVVPRALAQAPEIVATGIGSSEAHARFLVSLLSDELGLAARHRAAGEFLGPPPESATRAGLVVFSQGLSPNARFALEAPEAWAALLVCSSLRAEDCDDERRRWLLRAQAAGAALLSFGDPAARNEYGTLVRVAGPLLGLAAALRVATALALARGLRVPAAWTPDLERLSAALARAPGALAAALARAPADALARPLAFLASGSYAERVANLPLKLMEGLLLPRAPVFDPIGFAHGPLQQAWNGELCLLALERPDAAGEAELLQRIASLLDPERHRLVRLPATLPSPCAAFEHELMLNELLRLRVQRQRVDPASWPGRGADGPLYAWAPPEPRAGGSPARASARRASALASLTWPELEGAIAAGARTAVVPLGALEQHGPHLPFATDAWIADALAERLCARVPDAIRIPALALGCSEEHADFPGTLSLSPATLRALLGDVLASLRRAGFERAFVFSAHGGNDAWLRAWEAGLASECAPLALGVSADPGAKSALFRDLAARAGVSSEASGRHAGELETSILLALAPDAVRSRELRPGLLVGADDPREIFYPSLRPHARDGTVGDPTCADAGRAADYLEAWVGLLLASFAAGRDAP